MVIDTSAIMAIAMNEPPKEAIEVALAGSTTNRISTGTYVELTAVASQRMPPAAMERTLRLLDNYNIRLMPFDAAQARMAADAYRLYGRGSGHPARLNFGDCFSYALAATLDEPLLFTGEDFAHTDIRIALRP